MQAALRQLAYVKGGVCRLETGGRRLPSAPNKNAPLGGNFYVAERVGFEPTCQVSLTI